MRVISILTVADTVIGCTFYFLFVIEWTSHIFGDFAGQYDMSNGIVVGSHRWQRRLLLQDVRFEV